MITISFLAIALDLDLTYSLLKILAMIATGVFGALALLTKYKDANGNITKWGKFALGGICMTLAVSLAIYAVEASRAKRSAETAKAQA